MSDTFSTRHSPPGSQKYRIASCPSSSDVNANTLSSPVGAARPRTLDAGGLGSIEDFLTAYEHTSGITLDRKAFHWWLVSATLRWGIICRYQAERHLSGHTRSVELATIGRRVCETEWDLLDLLEDR